MSKKSSFELWYKFFPNPFQEEGELGNSWGRFGIKIDGKELFTEMEKSFPGLEWNLIYLNNWIEKYLSEISTNSYPGNSFHKPLDEYQELQKELDVSANEVTEKHILNRLNWFSIRNIWNVGQGCKSPSIFFIEDKNKQFIEINWDKKENLSRGFQLLDSESETIEFNILKEQLSLFQESYLKHTQGFIF